MATELPDIPGGGMITVDPAHSKKLADDPNLMHIIFDFSRQGSHLFCRILELNHYRPGTVRNDDFNMTIIPSFPAGSGFPWAVIHIPIRDQQLAEEAAHQSDMKITRGSPMVLGGLSPERLEPFTNERCWNLTNQSGSKIQDQKSRGLAREEMEKTDNIKIRQMEYEHELWMDQQHQFWYEGGWWFRCKNIGQEGVKEVPGDALLYFVRANSKGEPIVWWTDKMPARMPEGAIKAKNENWTAQNG